MGRWATRSCAVYTVASLVLLMPVNALASAADFPADSELTTELRTPIQQPWCSPEASALGSASNAYLVAEGALILAFLTGNPIAIAGALFVLAIAGDNLGLAAVAYEDCVLAV